MVANEETSPQSASLTASSVRHSQSASFASSLAAFLALLGSSYRPALRWPGIPGLRSASRCSSIQHGRPTPSHRPALTLARCSAPADFASLRVLGAPAASRPLPAHCVCSRLQPLRGLQRPAVGTGMHFYPQFAIVDPHRTQSVLVALVAHWAYFGLFRAQRAAFVRILNSQWSSCCA